ncbi:MAG: hypothetical protein AAGA87_13900 [Pseudomonadota bacterium]
MFWKIIIVVCWVSPVAAALWLMAVWTQPGGANIRRTSAILFVAGPAILFLIMSVLSAKIEAEVSACRAACAFASETDANACINNCDPGPGFAFLGILFAPLLLVGVFGAVSLLADLKKKARLG